MILSFDNLVLEFLSQDIALCMQGLGNMNTEYQEVVEVLEAIRIKIKTCPESFDMNIVTVCLQGLRSMDNDMEVVKLTIDDILAKVTDSDNNEIDKDLNSKDFDAEVIIVNKADAANYGVQPVDSKVKDSSNKSSSTSGGKSKGSKY